MHSFGFLGNKKKQEKEKKPSVPYVELQVSTWSKDSHALYDYEGVDNKFQVEKHDLKDSVNIYRHVTTTRTVFQEIVDESKGQKKKDIPMQNIYISSLVWKEKENSYFVQSADISGVEPHPILKQQHPDLFKNSFLVLRDYFTSPQLEGYPLKTGNILRLGRVEYLIIEIRNNDGTQTFKETSHLELNRNTYEVKQNLTGTCKVCLCEQSTEQDPLINPCNCKGSCEFIHVGCLKNWMFSKIKKEIVGVATTYNFSKLQCEICKVLLPKTIKLATAKQVDMISLDKPQKPYIILESFCDKDIKEEKKERNLHLLCPDEQYPIKLGRGHQCQIRLTDISVSRTHSEIRYEKGQFYVKDLKSKFGTLIKFREEFELKEKIKLQYGRSCFEFRLITKEKLAQKQEEEPEEVPVFYTRSQLREMGQLEDDDEEEY